MKKLSEGVRTKLEQFVAQATSNMIEQEPNSIPEYLFETIYRGRRGVIDYSDDELLCTFISNMFDEQQMGEDERSHDYFPCFEVAYSSTYPPGCTLDPIMGRLIWDRTDDLYDWVSAKVVEERLVKAVS